MLPQHLVDRILSYVRYLPIRATCTNQCDHLTNILSDSFPALDRSKQLRRAIVDGDLTKLSVLLKFRTDPNAFVNETIEEASIIDPTQFRLEDGEIWFAEDVPMLGEELATMGAEEVGLKLADGDGWMDLDSNLYFDLPPSAPLVAASVLRRVVAVGQLLQAGAHFDPVVWKCERAIQNRRRKEEDRRRAKEDQRRAEEDRRRAKEDRRRAKEDSRRARQDARMRQLVEEQEESEEESLEEEPEEQVANKEQECFNDTENPDIACKSVEAQQFQMVDLNHAMQASKEDLLERGVPLSSDGVVILRLTKRARAPEVLEALRDPILEKCHKRLEAAGCVMTPGWTEAKLLVPLSQELVNEFLEASDLQLAHHHIIALSEDIDNIKAALRRVSPNYKQCPRLKPEHYEAVRMGEITIPSPSPSIEFEANEEDDEADDGFAVDVVAEQYYAWSTDSEVGFPLFNT